MTDTRPPAERGPDLNGHLEVNVTVYFPVHAHGFPVKEPGAIYVQAAGRWLRYEKSGPCSKADTMEQSNGANGSNAQEIAPENHSLHWAGHQSGRSQELIRERKPRVYYDPQKHPSLFVTENGGPPTAPLPALELNGHQEDSEPWLDPDSGTRFTCEQARTVTAVLRYAPRKERPALKGEHRSSNQVQPRMQTEEPPCSILQLPMKV
jgi:hypothetical protein